MLPRPRFAFSTSLLLLLAAPSLPALQSPAGGGASYTNSTPVTILDVSTVSSSITVSGAFPFLLDVNLRTFITHTFAADLDITLTSPSGTVVTITTDNGSGNDNVFNGTVWDDDGGVPVTDATFTNGVVKPLLAPEEAFGALQGEDPNGLWTLTITDDLGADVGTLHKWTLSIATLDGAPVATTTGVNTITPVAIPDAGTVTATLDVSGAPPFLLDLDLTTFLTHTNAADLDLTLTSPEGTVVTITTDNGGTNDDVFNGTVWDDGGVTPVTDAVYADGVTATPLVPEEAFGAFVGEDPNGTWTLTITDDTALETGSLDSWELSIASTGRNVRLGGESRAFVRKAAFGINWAGHNLGIDADTLAIAGVLNPADFSSDLTGAAVTIGVNGNPIVPTVALTAAGTFASASGASPSLRCKFSPKNGAFALALRGIDLSTVLGLTNTTEFGGVPVTLEVSLVGAGLNVAKVSGDFRFVYATALDKATKGKFSFKTNDSLSGVFQSLRTNAVEQPGGGHLVRAAGPLVDTGGGPLVPTGDVTIAIGSAAPITVPFASLVLTGTGAETLVTLPTGSVAELKSFTIANAKRAFAFATEEVAGTGIPAAVLGSALSHDLPVTISVVTAGGTVDLDTTVELLRKSDTAVSWKR
ncbi:MAG TPA: proprotein convertase P-domain-containing protein [Planctomycetota bacterium]|jgi:subtilisin-like proprotein convertase family protein|nr:proprotein convertase P-domain-containing protein [Planctomycetota bacterium]